MNQHVCKAAGWLALGLLALPAVALAADGIIPGSVPGADSIGSISWPAAFVFGVYSLKGAKLPPVIVRIRVDDSRDETGEAPKP